MDTKQDNPTAYFMLTARYTVATTWQKMPAGHASPDDARSKATERGIYPVTYVCVGRRCDLEPFAIVRDDERHARVRRRHIEKPPQARPARAMA